MRFSNIAFGLALLATQATYAQVQRSAEEIRQAANTIVLKDARVLESASYSPKALEALAQEMTACGLIELSTSCLDGTFVNAGGIFNGTAKIETKDSVVLISKISTRNLDAELALVVEAEKDSAKGLIRSVSIIEVKGNSPIEAQYQSGKNKKLISATLPENMLEYLVSELNQELDVRKLFHFSNLILKMDKEQTQRKVVVDALNSHHQIITNSDSKAYKLGLIKLLRSELASENELVITIATDLLDAKGDASQLAAITLVDKDQKSEQISEEVRLSLKNSNWDMRRLGIIALNKIKTGVDDEILILNKLADSDQDVQKTALAAIKTFNLSSEHVPTLNALTQNSSWAVRQAAVGLLSKIATPESRSSVIARMGDFDEDVRKSSITALNKLTVSDADLANLQALLKHSNWSTRQAAVSFMGKIPSENASLAIISALSDTDEDVRRTAITLLSSRELTDASVPKLAATSKNSNWSVRASAANLLGKIKTDAATAALIPMINDSDSDVKNAAIKAISGRAFNEAHVDGLIAQLSSSNWDTRLKAARLIGTTSSCKGLNALVAKAKSEGDADVRGEIARSISAIKNSGAVCQ